MNNLKKSVRVLSQVFDVILGSDFVTPTDSTYIDYLKTRYGR